MLVVSDSTPLHALILIGRADLLGTLYDKVIVPPAVFRELSHTNAPTEIRAWLTAPPAWFEVKIPTKINPSIGSGAGEREAICLALELRPDFLLVDDKEARTIAQQLNIRITGTIGILELAASRNLIDMKPTLNDLAKTGFYLHEEIIADVLGRQPPSQT